MILIDPYKENASKAMFELGAMFHCSWVLDVKTLGQLSYKNQRMARLTILKVTYLSCPTSELHEIFLGISPMTEVDMVFYGLCLGTSPILRK